jgi:hypothetical protein
MPERKAMQLLPRVEGSGTPGATPIKQPGPQLKRSTENLSIVGDRSDGD